MPALNEGFNPNVEHKLFSDGTAACNKWQSLSSLYYQREGIAVAK